MLYIFNTRVNDVGVYSQQTSSYPIMLVGGSKTAIVIDE